MLFNAFSMLFHVLIEPGLQVTEKGRDHGNCDSKGRPFGSQVCGRGPCSVTSNQRSDWERSDQRSDHELSRLGSAQTMSFLDWERSDHELSQLGALRPALRS